MRWHECAAILALAFGVSSTALDAQLTTSCRLTFLEAEHAAGNLTVTRAVVGDNSVAVAGSGATDPASGVLFYDISGRQYADSFAAGSSDPLVLFLTSNDQHLAFTSPEDLGTDEGRGLSRAYAFSRGGGGLVSIGDSAAANVFSPRISEDGNQAAFITSGDPTGDNPDGGSEVFLSDLGASGLTQVTDFPTGLVGWFDMSADASRFAVIRYVLPSTSELWIFDLAMGTSELVTSDLAPESVGLSMDGSGRWIVFASERDLVPFRNADGNAEIFVYDAENGDFSQLTLTLGGDSRNPRISFDGQRVVFQSTSILGSDDSLVLADLPSGPFFAVTPPGIEESDPSISRDGQRIVFSSLDPLTDVLHTGSRGYYLVDCARPFSADIPALRGAGAATLIVLLIGAGCTVARRARRDGRT